MLVILCGAFVVSTALTLLVRAVGRRGGLHDTPGAAGHVKPVTRRVPNIGGVAVFVTVAVFMLCGLGIAARSADPEAPCLVRDNLSDAAVHLPGIREQTPMALGLLGCLLVLHVMGLIDDRRALPALPKLGLMVCASGVMAAGFDVRLMTMLDAYGGGAWLSVGLTVVWFVVVTNAMNFMDNMDGLSAGTGAVAASLFLIAALVHGQWFVGATLAVLVGALLGFLVFNFPWPGRGGASIFLGDGGSLVVGFLLAFLTVRTTYVDAGVGGGWYAVFMPLCVLAVPIYDLVSVSVIRVSQGRSPMVGDQQHFSHRLRERGLTVRRTLLVIYGCTAVTGVSGIMLGLLPGWAAALAGMQVVLVLVLIGVFEHSSRMDGMGTMGHRPGVGASRGDEP